MHPDDAVLFRALLADAVAAATPLIAADIRVASAAGWRWLAMQAQVTFDPACQPLRVTGVNIDITARKRAEERLRHLQAVSARLVEAQTLEAVRQVILGEIGAALGFEGGGIRLVASKA